MWVRFFKILLRSCKDLATNFTNNPLRSYGDLMRDYSRNLIWIAIPYLCVRESALRCTENCEPHGRVQMHNPSRVH